MSDAQQYPGPDAVVDDETQPHHHPKHRREGVPVDAEPILTEFGENPDTSEAG